VDSPKTLSSFSPPPPLSQHHLSFPPFLSFSSSLSNSLTPPFPLPSLSLSLSLSPSLENPLSKEPLFSSLFSSSPLSSSSSLLLSPPLLFFLTSLFLSLSLPSSLFSSPLSPPLLPLSFLFAPSFIFPSGKGSHSVSPSLLLQFFFVGLLFGTTRNEKAMKMPHLWSHLLTSASTSLWSSPLHCQSPHRRSATAPSPTR
jgi:hypothetical protein